MKHAALVGCVSMVLGSASGLVWAQQERRDQEAEESFASVWFADPNYGYGPFRTVSLSPFASLRSGFAAHFPSSLPEGGFELHVGESWAKNLSVSDNWLIDYDVLRSNVSFSWGLLDSLRVEIEIESAERTGGGALDAFIIGFHNAFGLAIGFRDEFGRGSNRFEVVPPGGGARIVVDENDSQPYEQAGLITLQHTLRFEDEDLPLIATALTLRTSLAPGDLRGGSPVEVAFSFGVAKNIEGVKVYLGGHVGWHGREDFFGLKLRAVDWSTLVGVEWPVVPRFSLIGQYLITSAQVDRLQDFSRPSHEISAGFKWELSTGVVLEVAFLENVINFLNSPDAGFHFGVTVRW